MTIKQAYRQNTVVEFDYRKGTFQDLSPNAFAVSTTFTTVNWCRTTKGKCLNLESGLISLGNKADFDNDQPQSFAYVLKTYDTSGTLSSKSDGSSTFEGWNNYLVSGVPTFRIYENGTSSGIRCNGNGYIADGKEHVLIITYSGSGTTAGVKFYLDGVQVTTQAQVEAGFTSSTLNTANWTAYSVSYGGGALEAGVNYLGQWNVEFTPQEAALLYEEILQEPHYDLPYLRRLKKTDGNSYECYIANGLGWNESFSDVTSGWIDNTNFHHDTGNFRVYNESKDNKSIICISSGNMILKTNIIHGQWEMAYFRKTGSQMFWYFIDENCNRADIEGYYFIVVSNGQLQLRKRVSGSVSNLFATDTGIAPVEQWVKFKITRDAATNTFSTYMDTGSGYQLLVVPSGSGSNPVIDSSVLSSKCMHVDIDTDDRVKDMAIIEEGY